MKKTLIIISIVLVLVAVVVGAVMYNKAKKRKALFYESGKPKYNLEGNPIDESGNSLTQPSGDAEINEDLGDDDSERLDDLSTLN
jgi:hypothetical protein